MLIAGAPGALLWPAAMIVWGPGYVSAQHSHHAIQLVLALAGALRIRGGPREKWLDCGAALVRTDAPHAVEAPATPVLIAFVDPESDLGAALTERTGEAIALVPDTEIDRWRSALGEAGKLNAVRVERWVRSALLHRRRAPRIHPRVNRVLRFLRENLESLDDPSLPALAAIAGLSPSRFMHVFTESVGVAIRPYIRWLRLQRAAGELIGGASITRAAHEAGFSDAAHLTRTFRRTLGTTPSEIARRRSDMSGVAVE